MIGRIINVIAVVIYLGDDGMPDYSLRRSLTYDPVHFDYVELGNRAGRAFQEGRKLEEKSE